MEISRLRSFELFSELKEDELAEIAKACKEFTVPAGSILIRQGQVGNEVYLMEDGEVSIYRGEPDASRTLAVLRAPAVFGEMAVVNPERIRTASVKALSHLRLLGVPVTALVCFLRRFPTLRSQLRRLLAERSSREPLKKSA